MGAVLEASPSQDRFGRDLSQPLSPSCPVFLPVSTPPTLLRASKKDTKAASEGALFAKSRPKTTLSFSCLLDNSAPQQLVRKRGRAEEAAQGWQRIRSSPALWFCYFLLFLFLPFRRSKQQFWHGGASSKDTQKRFAPASFPVNSRWLFNHNQLQLYRSQHAEELRRESHFG